MERLSRLHSSTTSSRWGVWTPFLFLLLPSLPCPAWAQIQLRCDGTLLEARGSAEQELPIGQLRFSLSLEAEQRSSDGALALLQERLASVRSVLQGLQVRQLRVSSPSTWQRPAEPGRPAISQSSLQVSGLLDPSHLQALIRHVGAHPGVRLAPVSAEADPARSSETRRALLAAAYRQAFQRAQDVASALGLSFLKRRMIAPPMPPRLPWRPRLKCPRLIPGSYPPRRIRLPCWCASARVELSQGSARDHPTRRACGLNPLPWKSSVANAILAGHVCSTTRLILHQNRGLACRQLRVSGPARPKGWTPIHSARGLCLSRY